METIRIEGRVKAITGIHHGGDEKTGVECVMRRIKYIVDGKPVEIPYIEGNAIRGMLRRMLVEDFISRVGYEIKGATLYHMLYSGGILENVDGDGGKLNIELRKNIRALLPPIALLGSSYGNQAFSGKLIVGKMLPICKELNDFLPCKSELSVFELCDETFSTRRDDLRDTRENDEQAVQMKYSYEIFCPGTEFYHHFALMDTTPIEKACFAHMLDLWAKRPYVAARSAVGNGEIRAKYECEYKAWEYHTFVNRWKDDIVALLSSLDKKGAKNATA